NQPPPPRFRAKNFFIVLVVFDCSKNGFRSKRRKDTNKRGQKQASLLFAEREYLRHSQNTNKPNTKANDSLIMPRRSIFGEAKDTNKPNTKANDSLIMRSPPPGISARRPIQFRRTACKQVSPAVQEYRSFYL
ncbi:hypothetical protein, partial [uncultured Alistipes sp.]|uniref:hypothetical protein n=1 Tax=uncultured Alistipes sp. TaxID=538949 RepID=UPI00265CDDE2